MIDAHWDLGNVECEMRTDTCGMWNAKLDMRNKKWESIIGWDVKVKLISETNVLWIEKR